MRAVPRPLVILGGYLTLLKIMDMNTSIIIINTVRGRTTDAIFCRPMIGFAQEHSQVAPQADHCEGGMIH